MAEVKTTRTVEFRLATEVYSVVRVSITLPASSIYLSGNQKTILARSCKAHRSNYANDVYSGPRLIVASMSFAIQLLQSERNF